MSAATVNTTDAVKPGAAGVVVGGSAKQQVKSSSGGKALDSARKQAASPVDGQKGKPQLPQPKAWQGPNPITQRASTHTPNGTEKPLPKLPPQSQSQSKSTADSNPDKHAYDRTLFLLANLTGLDATLTLKNGEQFTGVFSGGSFESNSKHQYILKMVRRARLPNHQQVNGNAELPNEYIGEGEDHMMIFDKDDTVDLAVNDVVTANALPLQNGSASSSFRTDTEISGRDPSMPRERELQRWDASAASTLDMSLEDSGETGWDQFATNERMYGVESTYDENIYTTAIDRTDPLYKQREAAAARIAREIEGSAPATAHVAEERRVDADWNNAVDEEEKYSGVQREAVTTAAAAAAAASALPKRGLGAYVPPSQRPITNAPTVPGAPFDPAIISSSLAKPAPPPATEEAEEAAPTAEQTETLVEEEQTLAPTESAITTSPTPAASQTQTATKKQAEHSAEEHVRNAADAFKLFANDQKLRARITAEARRSNARAEKNVKLNDLKKFSENFRVKSRVPDDLVPILAKDPHKQIEIQRRAEQAAQQEEVKLKERESQKTPSAASPTPSSSSQVGATVPPLEQRSSFSQQATSRARVMQNLRGLTAQPSPGKTVGQGSLAANRGYPRPGAVQPLPGDMRIPTGPAVPSADGPLSPTSATKLNVKAFEFRPAASSFTPSGTSPSPQRTTGSSMDRSNVSESAKTAAFFDKDKKPVEASERKDLDAGFQPMKRMLDAEYTEEHKKINAANGGVPRPYQTPVTWHYIEANVNVSYRDSFVKSQVPSAGPSPMHTPNPNAQMPHAHQLPPHMQGTPMSTPSSRPPYMPPPSQPGASPQVFDPRMQQFGPNGSVQSSPRFPQAQVAFNGQMPGMPMQPFANQQMQGYGMSPSMPYRQMNMPPTGPMMMMPPHQQHGQMGPIPQGYPPRGPAGPQFNPQLMGGVPMMQQHSAGGFINGQMPGMPPPPPPHQPQQQQQQSYSPMPPPSQPAAAAAAMLLQQNHGYTGSPRPHMMQHSGSHQGFQPGGMGGGGGMMGMQMQPPFMGAPPPPAQQQQQQQQQHYPYHMQQRQMSSGGGYPQMTPRQQYSVPSHPSPGMGGGGVAGQGDEGK